MRSRAQSPMLKARAIAGTHVVILAWDLRPGQRAKLDGLLGFAIERSELKADGSVEESYWMRAIKRFKNKDKGLPAGTPVPTSDHPVQAFQWGDYTAKSGRHYRYRIVPMYGQSKLLTADDASAVVLDIRTEPDATSAYVLNVTVRGQSTNYTVPSSATLNSVAAGRDITDGALEADIGPAVARMRSRSPIIDGVQAREYEDCGADLVLS